MTVEELEQRIQNGWEKFPTPRPYITVKKDTYITTKTCAVFVDAEYGEWEAIAAAVMRGGMHPKRRQNKHNIIAISKEDFHDLYIVQNLSVKEIAALFNCSYSRVIKKIREFGIRKPMELKKVHMAKTSREKYGYDHAMQNKEFYKEAMKNRDHHKAYESYKQTMQERYGVDNPFELDDVKKRGKLKMLEKYGTLHALQSDICRDKYKNTIRKKYEDDSLEWAGYCIKEIRDKTTSTNQIKYGVDFPFQSTEIQEKIKQTFLEKYNTTTTASVPSIREKMTKSLLKRFGIHHLSIPEMRERIKQTSLEKYGCECSLQNEEVKQKSRETRLKNDSFKTSAIEKDIRNYIQSLVPMSNILQNVRDIISPYELDIVLPEFKLAVEVNGLYWHSEAWIDTKYHAMKLELCHTAGYRLITIFEHEWNIRKTVVKSRLKAILGCNKHIIGARQTKCDIATKDEALDFLREFHLQGGAKIEQAFKLTYNDLIVAVMTFARHHRQNSKYLVLNRFCVRDDYSIIGGVSKLLKYANIKETIISFSDNRWSEGDIYRKLNFKLDAHIKPDYFYINNKKGVISKQSMKKTKIESQSGMTEHELRLAQGYLRVYDCGKIRWKLDYIQ